LEGPLLALTRGSAASCEVGGTALNDFDPTRPQGLHTRTVAWLDSDLRITLDHVEAVDPRSAIEAAKADHHDDPDAVLGDVVVLLGHRDDELYAAAQRNA
jgi:hypothetical protein